MRWIRFAVLVAVASILQAGLMGVLAVLRPEIRPDLLLILLVFFAIRCTRTDAVITSFAIGFAADLTSPTMGVMGPRIISFGLCGTLLSDLQSIISIRRLVYRMVAIFVTGMVTATISLLLTFLRAEALTVHTGSQVFWQPLYSALLGPLFSLPVGWLMRMNQKNRPYRRRRRPR